MRFPEILEADAVLAEGAVVERLRRGGKVRLDPQLEHAALIYSPAGAGELEWIYREYLAIGMRAGLPLLCFSPTWRANPERLRAAGLAHRDVNGDGVRFVRALAAEYPGPVSVGGLMGCRGDCYRPEQALSERESGNLHLEQARALANARPDFLFGATLPAVAEAAGMARAMARTGLPYILSFIIEADGTVLDGTPLCEAVARIDRDVAPAPAAYFVNCVHPDVLRAALERAASHRVTGFQGNTSRLKPLERDGLPQLDAEDPEAFAAAMLDLHRSFGIRVLGGCCGTDAAHIGAIAAALSRWRKIWLDLFYSPSTLFH